LVVGDLVLSRDEHDANGLVVAQRVEEVFERFAMVWELRIDGRVIETTPEHPFYRDGEWVDANRLREGDRLLCEGGRTVVVESIVETSRLAKVYNFRVGEYHTYFVGGEDWGWAVWAHNAEYGIGKLKQAFTNYLDDIEKQSGRKLTMKQRREVWKEFKSGKIQQLSPGQNNIARSEFNSSKNNLVIEWEANTGKKWPTYRKDHVNADGELIVGKGWKFDAHHVIEEQLNGPAKWWNIHPVHRLKHQGGIHRSGGPAVIFEDMI
jgi:Pretoxin HINT domain